MKTMLISGGKGNFASQIIKFNTEYQIHAPSRLEMDITDYDKVAKWIEQVNPDIFLHAAAFTRPMNKHERYPVEYCNGLYSLWGKVSVYFYGLCIPRNYRKL